MYVLLTPAWNPRKGQAKDRFALACNNFEEKNDKCLRMSALPELVQLHDVAAGARKLQDDREKAEQDPSA